ncbi:MAG: putative sugar nucleotidyl transferase [Ignavibacteriales bacterium]|nr:putative sugar nucleotidyl transferase [Ignavibacteriales bacterium]
MQLCIFEDIYFDRLEPLIYSRPVHDLICGINSIRAKILRAYPGVKYSLHTRPYLDQVVKSKNPAVAVNTIEDNDCLFINGRVLAPPNMEEIISLKENGNKLYLNKGTVIAARVSGKKLEELKSNLSDLFSNSDFDGFPTEQVDIKHVDYIWDLAANNRSEFITDYNCLIEKQKEKILGKVYDGVHFIEKGNIFIDEGAEIKPGVVLDASKGPIYIDKNAVVAANAVVENCVYLGESSQIKSCARIYDNVSIGRICKIGGEVEDSIILPFTNKQHSGFLGHAYLGSWVNLGADTNCSDLKNNYSTIKIYVNGDIVDSGTQFLGLIMGDHSKSAINTMFNTGTIVGFSCNIFGAGFPDKYIPSFSWGGVGSKTTYDLLRSIETANRVMIRRNHVLNEYDEKLFKKIFDLTAKERRKRGYPY